MQALPQSIRVFKALDVERIEGELAELWKQTAGDVQSDDEEVLLRSRVANLMIFVRSESEIAEARETLSELSEVHPCRALMMVAEREADARDIELHVSTFCRSGKPASPRHLCCEEVTLSARGHFVFELPSAAIPLLVSDLPVFLWWRDILLFDDKCFTKLSKEADRIVIDSADFQDPSSDLPTLAHFLNRDSRETAAVSDVNWARLTSWRALLASFYDVPKYRLELDRIDSVRIDYVGPGLGPETLATQALMIAGWLGSRLGWSLAREQPGPKTNRTLSVKFTKGDQLIALDLNRVERPEMKPGRLAQVELKSGLEPTATFLVSRSADGLHLKTEAKIGSEIQPGRVLPVRNRSTAELLSREMEILSKDSVYEEAIGLAAEVIKAATSDANTQD